MTKTKTAILLTLGAATAFALGRYTVPTKIKVETKIVEVEKKRTTTDKDTSKKTLTKTTRKPDGTETTVTKVVEDSKTKRETNKDTTTTAHQTTTKETSGGRTSVLALMALDLKTPTSAYGASINRMLVGPVTVGAFGFTNGTVGLGLGLTF